MLQRGRRSESTEISVARRSGGVDQEASKGPSIRVDGDAHHRRGSGTRHDASKGPSIRVDGDAVADGRDVTGLLASKGPSIRVDGDLFGAALGRELGHASKGPSIRVDGDEMKEGWRIDGTEWLQRGRRSESTEIRGDVLGVERRWSLQRGRRSESTEIPQSNGIWDPQRRRFKGAVDQSRRRWWQQRPERAAPHSLQRGRRSESTEIPSMRRRRPRRACRFKGAVDQSRRRSPTSPPA